MNRTTYCQTYWPDMCEHILRVADEACKREFIFDLNWDMERTHEPVVFEKEIKWEYMPEDDPEFIWQFNRHRFAICLGQAYILTKNTKYVDAFKSIISEWIAHAPLTKDSEYTTWRTLETGIRIGNWTRAYLLFADALKDETAFKEQFFESIKKQTQYIREHHWNYKYMSNWGILEYHGLYLSSFILPDKTYAKSLREFCLEALPIQLSIQFAPDGFHWEQSPMYHNEVLHCLLSIMLTSIKENEPLPESVTEKIREAAYVNVYARKPDYHQVMMGDSDDIDMRDIMTLAAFLFKDPVLKSAAYDTIDFESIFELSMEDVEIYRNIPIKFPEQTEKAFSHSGNYYMRSDWSQNASFLHFHNGTVGAGHGHCDKLHIDMVINGEDVLMDAGRYSYCVGPRRFQFKEEKAHNTITVDNTPFSPCVQSWECEYLTQPVKQQMYETKNYSFVQGGHLGYTKHLSDAVFINRKIVYIKPDIFVVCDEGYTTGSHTYQQYFHYSDKGNVEFRNNIANFSNENVSVDTVFLTNAKSRKLLQTNLSRHYNEKTPNQTVLSEYEVEGFFSSITVFCNKKDSYSISKIPVQSDFTGKTFLDSQAEAIKIENDMHTYLVVLCHEELHAPTDMIRVCDCVGFGNVIVFEPDKQNVAGTVLCW